MTSCGSAGTPQPTRSLHHLTDARLSGAVERFLEAERADAQHRIDVPQRHSQLKHAVGAER